MGIFFEMRHRICYNGHIDKRGDSCGATNRIFTALIILERRQRDKSSDRDSTLREIHIADAVSGLFERAGALRRNRLFPSTLKI